MTRLIFKAPFPFRSFFQEFYRLESASGIVLILCTIAALIWANSPLRSIYTSLLGTPLVVGIGDFRLEESLLHWINDGLMAVFFFVVGLEIKREILMGELRTWRRASLPIAAALGGMIVPALIYAAINRGQPSIRGWGIPMATDIAFSLGVLAILGTRAPLVLKVFLTALAIVDDIGAVLVIALFYSHEISLAALIVAGSVMLFLLLLNRTGVRSTTPYLLLGIVLWLAFLKSGIHATVAGVVLASMIPVRTHVNTIEFIARSQAAINVFAGHPEAPDTSVSIGEERQAAAQALEDASAEIESPLHRLEHDLHPWVTRLILPVFALANAGVPLTFESLNADGGALAAGVFAGLVLGKPLGVSLFSWLAVSLGWAELPNGMTWRSLIGVSLLTGIGFTMSIFIASLAFDDPAQLAAGKISVMAASLLAGVAGWSFILLYASRASDRTSQRILEPG